MPRCSGASWCRERIVSVWGWTSKAENKDREGKSDQWVHVPAESSHWVPRALPAGLYKITIEFTT